MDEELDETGPPQPKPSSAGFVAALLAVTLIGGGAGAGLATVQVDRIAAAAATSAGEPPERPADSLAFDETTGVARLEPVIANLAEPAGMFVRLDTSVVYDRETVGDVPQMKARLSQDILAHLRTVTLGEVTGASAFNHLRDDLNDRVRLVSDGTVREIVIETMVLQ